MKRFVLFGKVLCKVEMMKVFLFLIGLLSVIPVSSQTEDIDKKVKEIMRKYDAVGASTVVVKDNKIVYSNSFGYNPDYNDSSLRTPIPHNGIYVIASISKTFISTAIMQLVEKKKINLEDDVNNILNFSVRNPQYPNIPITVRMLLNHRSSINDKHYGWTLSQINPHKGNQWKECYNDYQPGTKFSYCNLNYNLLGAIIELVSGQRFFDYIDDNIIAPLGLNASYNLTKIDSALLVRAMRFDKTKRIFKADASIYNYQYYINKLKNYKLGQTTACFSPSGGMKISAEDLAKYMIMHMNYGKYGKKRILKKHSEVEMWKPQDCDTTYGLGFFQNRDLFYGENIIGVRGNAHGVHSAMYFCPERKFGVVVICNGCTNDRKMKNSIARELYKFFIKK